MTYPCGIIKDLLPLYIDDVCNEESRKAVQLHLSECAACRTDYETMKETGCFAENGKEHVEDQKLATSLKNVKHRINKRIYGIAMCAVAVALVIIGGYHLLFNAAVKDVAIEDVSISANVYPFQELIENQTGEAVDPDAVVISADENDNSTLVAVRIPEIGGETILMTENVKEEYQSLTVITVQSDYFLRNVKKDRKADTIYITEIKTTLLNNKAAEYQHNICTLEFGEINRIVFVDDNGTESVLWSR